jgi:hypothetical protein
MSHFHTFYLSAKNHSKRQVLKGIFDYVEVNSIYAKRKPESTLGFIYINSNLFDASVNNDHGCGIGVPLDGNVFKFSSGDAVKEFDSSKMTKDHITFFKFFDHEGHEVKFEDHFEFVVIQVSYGQEEEEFGESESEESVHNNDRERNNRKRINNHE